MAQTALGLDIGPNSIGWALVDEANEKIIDLGVRVFPEGVDNFDTSKEVSRNESRRTARGMRRQTTRRARRKRKLRNAIIMCGLFPADPEAQSALLQRDPYELRARALDEKLSLHEIGRIFYHLAQRRGYLSNSKHEAANEDGKQVLSEINVTAGQIEAEGCRTLGEFLACRHASFDHAQREAEDVLPNQKKEILKDVGRVRHRHLHRQMYLDEFDAIWDKQAQFHPESLTELLRYGTTGGCKYPAAPKPLTDSQSELEQFGIHGLIFFHRKLNPVPKEIIGLCELEPKQRRCPRADRAAERFRMYQEVNNLRYINPDTHQEEPLSPRQREMILQYLTRREKATFDQLRTKLGFLESVKFNLERGKRSSIKGSETDALMVKAVGKDWHKRDESEMDHIIRLLLDDLRDEELLAQTLVDNHGFRSDQAEEALCVKFPKGYVHLSLKAIEKLTPFLKQGLLYQAEDEQNSAIHAAGYLRRDELKRCLFDELPDSTRSTDLRIGDIPNPVVKRALVELKKVVNAIIREYGRPDAIHLEMGRDLRTRPKKGTEAYRKYMERIDDMRNREAKRDAAKAELRERNLSYGAGGRNILKLLLWEGQAHECVYCGNNISQEQLFNGEADIDHILPYKRCLDDSQLNKVITHRHCNAEKSDRTPFEWLADGQPEEYAQVCQHAVSLVRRGLMSYQKYKRFLLKELKLEDFIERQLNDTRYIAKLAGEYLRCLFEHDHDVLGLKGQLTAELRQQWGLNTILSELPDSPAWQAQADLRDGEKNRADHRHHAIDAIVIALTDRSRLQKLSRIAKQGGMRETGEILEEPWDNFREEVVEKISKVNVSHRVQRRARGQLHEDTIYGPTEDPEKWVSRKAVTDLSPNEIEKIRDGGTRKIIIDRLKAHGIDFGRGVKVDTSTWKKVLGDLRMPSGVPIKKVRIVKPEQTIELIRKDTDDSAYVKPGSTHHLTIFKFMNGDEEVWDAAFVTTLEAAARAGSKQGLPIIERDPQKLCELDRKRIPAHAEFVMSLGKGELVLLDIDGRDVPYVFNTAASTSRQMTFFPHTAANHKDKTDGKLQKYPSTLASLNPRKITVDPLGRIRWAND